MPFVLFVDLYLKTATTVSYRLKVEWRVEQHPLQEASHPCAHCSWDRIQIHLSLTMIECLLTIDDG